MPVSKRWTIATAAVLAAVWAVPPALAQRSYDIMVEEGGKPLQRSKKVEEPATERAPKKPPKSRPRGSSYVPPATLPRSEPARVAPPSVDVYKPPQINTYSDRVRNCIHSYPLNAGVGNNPTEQSAYIRQCAN